MIRKYDSCFVIFSHPEFVPGNSFKPPSIQLGYKSTSNLHPFNPRFKSTSNLHPFNRDAKALQTSIHSIQDAKALQTSIHSIQHSKALQTSIHSIEMQKHFNFRRTRTPSLTYLLTSNVSFASSSLCVFVCLLVYVRMWCVWCVLLCILFWMEQPHSLEFGSDFFLLFMDPWFGVCSGFDSRQKKS
jgi:hypothetical protein